MAVVLAKLNIYGREKNDEIFEERELGADKKLHYGDEDDIDGTIDICSGELKGAVVIVGVSVLSNESSIINSMI